MTRLKLCRAAILAISALFIAVTAAKAGPPFQTDDPEPVDFRHYEFYVFGNMDGTGAELDTGGPAIEFNWGVVPNVQLHFVMPASAIFPYNNPRYNGAGVGVRHFGLGDTEIGAKVRFIKETKHRPMIGTFTMIEAPTGNSNLGLGVGKVWFRLPVWVQKSFGPWTTYGGAGEVLNSQDGFHNFPFGGWLLQRDIGKKLTLGGEVFSHGGEGPLTTEPGKATLVDIGGYYYFRNPGFQLLVAYGHSVFGMAETYGYLGLYWTWGNSKEDKPADKSAMNLMRTPQIPGRM